MRRPSPAAYSMVFIARLTSPLASAIGFPSSKVILFAISSVRVVRIARALNRNADRCGAGVLAQEGKALLADSIA